MPRNAAQHPVLDTIELGAGRSLRLHERIGKGSNATVFRASYDLPSGVSHDVAVKVFDAMSSDEADTILSSLTIAARRSALIRHPNVVRVYDAGVTVARPYLVLENVEGVTLRTLMDRYATKKTRVPLDLALFILSELLEGLAGARTALDREGRQLGILHLGLTAGEVLLSFKGEVKVGDFELQSTRAGASSVRSLRAVAGRAVTMAPEIAQGDRGDARADVFAVGVLMRELLVGPRFPGALTNGEAIRLAREGFVQPLSFQPHLPEMLVSIMRRALEIDPDERHPHVGMMAFELRRVALGMGVGDARWFLRRTLEREWSKDAEVTAEVTQPTGPPAPFDERARSEMDLLPIAELPLPSSRRVRANANDDDAIACLVSEVWETADEADIEDDED